jgi:ABC-type Mn2+/Zn2+ transport system permease subunit
MNWLTDPYTTDFMRNAAFMSTIVGVLAPAVGVWVVLRRLAYLGDAMSHGTLAGVATAYFIGLSVTVGALVAGIIMGLLVLVLGRQRRVHVDAGIGVVETFMFAIGVILIARRDRIGVELTHYLFGQIITTTIRDITVNLALTVVALALVTITFSDLRAMSFDPVHARQVGVPVTALSVVLIVLISITVVVALGTVGLLMSVALLITPPSAARLVTNRIGSMTALAVLIGLSSALGGLTVSYHLAIPPGPTIALCTVVWFLGLMTTARIRGTGVIPRLRVVT